MADHTDDELLDALHHALELIDPTPDHVIEQARAALAWHGIDAELAELVFDSDTAALAGVRGGEAARQITFHAPGLEIEVEVVSERVRTVLGQLVPAQHATVDVRHSTGTVGTTTDALGRFTFEGIGAGPIKLTVETDTGMRVQTEGLTI
jgi:hypothetical protein